MTLRLLKVSPRPGLGPEVVPSEPRRGSPRAGAYGALFLAELQCCLAPPEPPLVAAVRRSPLAPAAGLEVRAAGRRGSDPRAPPSPASRSCVTQEAPSVSREFDCGRVFILERAALHLDKSRRLGPGGALAHPAARCPRRQPCVDLPSPPQRPTLDVGFPSLVATPRWSARRRPRLGIPAPGDH